MVTWIERLWQDVRYACRMLGRAPGFTVVAVLSLGVGIGANCAVFSLADALLLRPLPVARPSEVYTVGSATAIEAFGISGLSSSYRDYVDIRDRSRSFQGLAAFSYVGAGFTAKPGAPTALKMGMLSSGNLFRTMGVQPAIGRDFLPDEDKVPGRDAVVILGHGFWEQQFGGDPSVVGRRVDIDGHPFTVIGVAPAAFSGMDQFVRVDFFVPLMMSPRLLTDPKAASLEARDSRNLTLKGRLAPGVSQAMAQADVEKIGADLERAYPDTNKNRRWGVRSELQTRIAQSPPDAMLVAMLATLAAAVLLVACANVAGLLTSRAPLRAREMAMRLAIGAGRARLVRQLITESLLTALLGGLAGLGLGYAGITLFRQIELPSDLPIQLTLQMDQRALWFGLAVSLASALFSGVLPAIQASRADLTAVMKVGDAVTTGRRRRWGRAVLVGGQVALAVVLLTVSLFMYRGFSAQLATGPGYRTDHLLMMSFDTSLVRYTDAQSSQFFKEVADRAREVPGVVRVSMMSAAPMSNDVGIEPLIPEGYQFPAGKENASVLSFRIDEHYFDAMGLPLLRGRQFTVDDAADAPKVAIVNEQFAQHYWPNQDPIGKRFRQVRDQSWVEVVGVAKMSKYLFIMGAADRVRLSAVSTGPRPGDGDAGPDVRRSGQPRWSPARSGAEPGCEPPDLQRADDGRVVSDAGDEHLPRDSRHRGRDGPHGSRPRHRRTLQPGVVRGWPANARDRHSDGDRRRGRTRASDGARPGAAVGGRRPGDRSRGERRSRSAAAGGVSDGHQSARHGRAADGGSYRACGHLPCRVHPRAPRVTHESDAGVAERLRGSGRAAAVVTPSGHEHQ